MNTIPPPPGILTDEEFQTIQAAGGPQAAPPEDRDFMVAQVNQYKAFRISAPRAEDIEARTASRNFLDKLTLDPDGIAAANNIDIIAKAPPEQQAAIRDRLVVDSWLTDRLRSHTVITADGSTPAPELDPMRRDEYRDALAQELFGDNAPRGSDSALVAKLRERSDERRRHVRLLKGQEGTDDAAKAANAASLDRWAARSAYAGESMVQGFAKWKEQARKSPNWTPTAEKQALFEAWAEAYEETKARVAPYQADIRKVLDGLKAVAAEKDDFGTPAQFDEIIRPLLSLDEQTLRSVALPALRSMAELDEKPGGGGSYWDQFLDQMGKTFARGIGQGEAAITQNSNVLARALTRRELDQSTLPGMDTTQQQADVAKEQAKIEGENLVRTMLRSAMTSDIDPIKPISTGPIGKRLEQMAYDVAGTAAYMTMLSVPYAGTAMATASFADDTTAMLLNKHPNMKASDARAIATIAAPIQTGIEQLQRLQVFGKVPVFNKAMNALAGPGGNAAVRFGLYGATGTLVEYTEEKLQDAAPLAVQALASALKQDIPDANLDGFEAFDLRTFLAVAPFALIGAGVNVAQDKATMRQLVSDEAAMRAVGFSEDGIQTIQAAETTDAQTQAIRQAWETRDTTAPADERWQETVRKAATQEVASATQEVAAMAQAAGIQQVRRAPDGTTHITLADGTVAVADNPLEAATIIEGATDAAQGWDNVMPLTQMMDALDARPDAPTGAIDATIEERANVADLITRFTDIANDETATQDERDAAANYVQSLQQRAAIYEGQNPGQKIDWRKVTVAGQSDMEVRDGVATAVIRVDKGASPYVVLEETVEADFKAMEQAGELTVATAAQELRDLERRTGDAYLSAYTGDNPAADRLAVVEALSKAAQIYATGKARAGGEAGSRAAGVLREWRKAARGKLMQAEREGVAPKVIAYLRQKAEWLKAVIGQAIRMNRARREARDAGETFPLERFLQRVTGVAPQMQAAEEVTDAAAEVWDDEGLTYIPPDGDELTPFSFQPSEPERPRQMFSEDNRVTSLNPSGAMLRRIMDENPGFDPSAPSVKVYRAAIGKTLRDNDFVALRRSVAVDHLENLADRGETGTVTEYTVNTADLLMGNDATEFVWYPKAAPTPSFSFQPTGIFEMSEASGRAQVAIAPDAQATAKGLADKIDNMYESGQTEGVEDLEAQLEAMLDFMDTGSADLEQNAEEARDIDQFSPSPGDALVSAWISWNNPTAGYRPSEENVSFGAYMRNLEGDASWVIRPEVTDQQIEEAARDALAVYMRRREALTSKPQPTQISFSFQPTAILDDLAAKVEARMSRSPQARLEAVRAAVDNLAALKQAWQRRRDGAGISDERSKASLDAEADVRQAFRAAELMQAAGISYATAREIVEGRRRAYEETLARETHARGVEDKTAQAIRREAATRQAFKRDELLQQVDDDFAQTLSTVYRDFGFWDGPALRFLSKQDKGSRKGTLLSYSKAKRFAGKGAYVNPAVWDGSHELPRTLFAGTMQPDVAAQELFSAHPELFPANTTAADVTPDMMWDAIGRELRDNKKMMEATKAYQAATRATADEARAYAEQWEGEYKANLEAARMAAEEAASAYVATATDNNEAAEKATQQAAKEAAAWRRKAQTMQNQDWGSKETLVRAMRTLDAILSAFPAAVRGKVGGWLALARIGTQDRMAEEIDRRITILDRELERELRKDALEELDALRERAKPKREGGKKPTGKLGAEAHRFFDRIEAVAKLSADEVEAEGIKLEVMAASAQTPEEAADIYERQQILDQFGGLDAKKDGTPLHDARALAAALAAAETVYETGRNQWRTQEEARLADIEAKAQATAEAIGTVTFSKFTAQKMEELTRKAQVKGGTWSIRTIRELLQLLMGRDNAQANQWADRIMDAMHARTDEINAFHRRWRKALEKATGEKKHKAQDRLWDMSTKRTVAVVVRPGMPVEEPIPIESIPNLAGLGYSKEEIADAEAAFIALPADSRAKNVTISRWQKGDEEAATLTDAEAVYYSMLWRQEQYRENLNRAGFGQETQDEIEAGMSDAAKSLREFMADEYAAGYYPLASLFRGMFGVDLPQVENYAQGRWWHKGGAEKAIEPGGTGAVEGGFRANMVRDRKAHLAKPRLENAFSLFLGHMAQTAHWKALAPLARELRGVFGNPAVKQAIVANHGETALAELTNWLDAIEANGIRSNMPTYIRTLIGWRANLMLAWKVSTALKNLIGGTILAAYKVTPQAYFRGWWRFFNRNLEVKKIWNSTMIQRRLEGGWSPEVRAAMARTFTDAPTLRRRFVQAGMELHGYADAFGLTLSAAIIYDDHLTRIREQAPGISDAGAEAHAMRQTQLAVNQIAQPVEITERSLVELSDIGRVLLTFGSEARQKTSRYLIAWSALLKGRATAEDYRALFIAHFVAAPTMQAIGNIIMDMRDDDDDQWFDEQNWERMDLVKAMAFGPLAGIPIIRDMADSWKGDSSVLAQTQKSLDAAGQIIEGPTTKEDEENKAEWYTRKALAVLKTADAFTGVSASVAEQALGFADNAFTTRQEIETMIGKLDRKLSRTTEPEERAELEARIKALKKRLE